LVSVIFPDLTLGDETDNPRKNSLYENQDFPHHLTGITDENGDRYAVWSYDSDGRAISSEHAQTTSPVGQEKAELNFIPLTNLALNKVTEQSTTIVAGGVSSSAVDGSTSGIFIGGSVSHTTLEDEPWWQVNLGSQATIKRVNIFNLTDCCLDRIRDFYVFVSEPPFDNQSLSQILANDNIDLVYHQGALSSNPVSIPLPSRGRYVRVQLSGTGSVTLAEVQVMGLEEN